MNIFGWKLLAISTTPRKPTQKALFYFRRPKVHLNNVQRYINHKTHNRSRFDRNQVTYTITDIVRASTHLIIGGGSVFSTTNIFFWSVRRRGHISATGDGVCKTAAAALLCGGRVVERVACMCGLSRVCARAFGFAWTTKRSVVTRVRETIGRRNRRRQIGRR